MSEGCISVIATMMMMMMVVWRLWPDQTPAVSRLSEAGSSRCSRSAADTLHSTHGGHRVDPARHVCSQRYTRVSLYCSHAVHNSAVSQSVTVARSGDWVQDIIIDTSDNIKIVISTLDNDTSASNSDAKNNVFHIRLQLDGAKV